MWNLSFTGKKNPSTQHLRATILFRVLKVVLLKVSHLGKLHCFEQAEKVRLRSIISIILTLLLSPHSVIWKLSLLSSISLSLVSIEFSIFWWQKRPGFKCHHSTIRTKCGCHPYIFWISMWLPVRNCNIRDNCGNWEISSNII